MNAMKLIIERITQVTKSAPQADGLGGYKARCPAHNDTISSLSIKEGDDGVLLHCLAGCKPEEIVRAIGLNMNDLLNNEGASFFGVKPKESKHQAKVYPTLDEALAEALKSAGECGELSKYEQYNYVDAAGDDFMAVFKYDPVSTQGSEMSLAFHVTEGGWCAGIPPAPLPLFCLPLLKRFSDQRVYVFDGEDCVREGYFTGLISTTSVSGSETLDKTDWSDLAGREVIILPNNSKHSRKYARNIARILKRLGVPSAVKIINPDLLYEEGKRFADYVRGNGNVPLEEIKLEIETASMYAEEVAGPEELEEISDHAPKTITKLLQVFGSYSYLVTWIYSNSGFDKGKRVVLRDDGQLFAERGFRIARPLVEMGVDVQMQSRPRPDKVLSGAALKKYLNGYRPDIKSVFRRIYKGINYYMDFANGFGNQRSLAALLSLYVLSSYFMDAFNVCGYIWPNGDKGSGKTKLLSVVTSLGYLGEMVTAGGTFASLRDMSVYGSILGVDDFENIKKSFSPDKRALLLAGNRRGVTIPLKEKLENGKWATKHVPIFCPKMFSAINLPDEVLSSRTIIIPLVRSGDAEKANRDPSDTEHWPVDRKKLVDDLWLLGLEHLVAVKKYDRKVAARVPVSGRTLEPWRAVLAVALWMQEEHGALNLFGEMVELMMAYQEERCDIEEDSPVVVLMKALNMMKPDTGTVMKFTPAGLASFMNSIADDEDLDYSGDAYTNAKKVGRILKQLRFKRGQRTAAGRCWEVTLEELEKLSRAYGVSTDNGKNRHANDDTSSGDVVSVVSVVSPERGEGSGKTSQRHQSAPFEGEKDIQTFKSLIQHHQGQQDMEEAG